MSDAVAYLPRESEGALGDTDAEVTATATWPPAIGVVARSDPSARNSDVCAGALSRSYRAAHEKCTASDGSTWYSPHGGIDK